MHKQYFFKGTVSFIICIGVAEEYRLRLYVKIQNVVRFALFIT